MDQEPILDIEVKAVHWLRGYTKAVVVDRLEFILNRPNFQQKIDEQVRNWPILELPKLNKMFVIRVKNMWHRAVIKFYCEKTNKCVLQLVDFSKTVDFKRNKNQLRSIEDPEIMNEPWGRYQCFLFGLDFVRPPFDSAMIELFDNFFTNCQLRAVMLRLPQTSDYMRKIYLCDFIKDCPEGSQSFRKLVLGSNYAQLAHEDKIANIRLKSAVERILVSPKTDIDPTFRQFTAASTTLCPSTGTSTLVTTQIGKKPFLKTELEYDRLFQLTIADIFGSPEIYEHILIPKRNEKIGQGSFGTVLKGTKMDTNTPVAVKQIAIPLSVTQTWKRHAIVSEVNILRAMNHDSIISFLGVYADVRNCTSSMNIYLCFTRAATDLAKYMRMGPLSTGMIMSATQMLLYGMDYIHKNGIVHRDIKPSNILIQPDGKVQLCDFGLAISKSDPHWDHRNTGYGTKQYMAPEMLLETYQYDTPVDMWGVGCILVEMATGKMLFGPEKRTWDEQINYVFTILGSPKGEDWPEFNEMYPNCALKKAKGIPKILSESPDLFELAERLLVLNPKKRYTAREALDDAFFWNTREEVLT